MKINSANNINYKGHSGIVKNFKRAAGEKFAKIEQRCYNKADGAETDIVILTIKIMQEGDYSETFDSNYQQGRQGRSGASSDSRRIYAYRNGDDGRIS